MIPLVRDLKNADSAVLREKPVISPRNISDSERPLPRIYKIKNSRDTKLVILRELRKGNPSSKRSGRRKEIPDLSISNLTSAEHALIQNRGRPFEITQFAR